VNGATLTLTSGQTKLELLDLEVAEPDVPLEGQTWTAYTTDSNGRGYDSGLFETKLEFADGKVTGTTGCHSLSGNAVVSGNRITFTDVRAEPSEPGCPARPVKADTQVRALLAGTLTYDIEYTELHLRPAAGDGLTLTSCSKVPGSRQGGCS
jgi:heat shock protein HslJ